MQAHSLERIAILGWLADLVLVAHAALALFIVVGLAIIVVGNMRGWRRVNARWFRFTHFGAILIVVAESWIGLTCPLTSLEMWLRGASSGTTYGGGFIEHWVRRFLYYDAPPWLFVLAYSLFALAVIAAWLHYPPERARRVK